MPRPLFDSPHLFGLHEPGGESHMLAADKPGWLIGTRSNDMTTTKIFDATGVERDMDWLRGVYGNVQIARASGRHFALTEIRESDGPAVLYVSVHNAAGAPQVNQPVANHWPATIPPLESLVGGGLQTMPHPAALVQRTSDAGDTGFGLGGGSYIKDHVIGGPHTVWVASPTLQSDVISGLGWLLGTNHRGPMRLTFGITEAEVETKPEPIVQTEPANRLQMLVVLAAPMMAGTRGPENVAKRAAEVLALLAAEVDK